MNLRLALRSVTRSPAFAILVIATMALGIGANTTMFSIIRAVFLRPLPFPDQDRIVTLWESDPQSGIAKRRLTPANFVDYTSQSTSFEAAGALPNWTGLTWPFNLVTASGIERIQGIYASSGFFNVLGVQPILGRTLSTADDLHPGSHNVVLSYRFWQQQFHGDSAIIGRIIRIDTWNGAQFTVLGVMPESFDFPSGAKIWASLADWGGHQMPPTDSANRCCNWYATFARLKPGVTTQQAAAELTAIARRTSERYPDAARVQSVQIVPLREQLVASQRLVMFALFGAVACVLLIACANVANLLLSRGVSRRKEMLTRLALGASRWHIARQLLAESLVLCTLGATLGLLLAVWAEDLLARLLAARIPLAATTRLDLSVLAFTAAVTILSAAACGLAPLIHWRAADWRARGQSENKAARGLRHSLIIAEVALSVLLVATAGLFIRTVSNLRSIDFGINTAHVLTLSTDFDTEQFRERGHPAAFIDQLIPRLASLPGVISAGAGLALPIENPGLSPITREDAPRRPAVESPQVTSNAVTPGYFAALGIALKRGRLIAASDTSNAKLIAVVSETAARRYWPNEDPIGKRFAMGSLERFGSFHPPNGPEVVEWREIVGVVADTRPASQQSEPVPAIYYSYKQYPLYTVTLVIRTTGDPAAAASAARAELRSLSNQVVITKIRTMDQVTSELIAEPRLRANLVALFSALAVLLGMLGIYGLTSYTVAQRTHEIGIRVALGASGTSVSTMIVRQSLRLAAIGTALGLAISLPAVRVLSTLLYGVNPQDPQVLTITCALLIGAAALASYIPARRTLKIDPAEALRSE